VVTVPPSPIDVQTVSIAVGAILFPAVLAVAAYMLKRSLEEIAGEVKELRKDVGVQAATVEGQRATIAALERDMRDSREEFRREISQVRDRQHDFGNRLQEVLLGARSKHG
jgi:predicted  nucleic acid-binding Zn-ribbon protein